MLVGIRISKRKVKYINSGLRQSAFTNHKGPSEEECSVIVGIWNYQCTYFD